MDYTINSYGKYAISFNGVVLNNCTVDSDCPGYSNCLNNKTLDRSFLEFPLQCACPIGILKGVNCDIPISDMYLTIGLLVIAFLLSISSFIFGIFILFEIKLNNNKKFTFNA